MAGNKTSNSASLVRQQIYSDTVLLPLKDTLMSDAMVHDLSEFKDGDTINVPILGEVTIHDRVEEEEPKFSSVSMDRFTLSITEHKEAANAISYELMEDGYATKVLQSQIIPMQRRALMESYETSLLAVANAQTLSDPNVINTAPHRFVATGNSNVVSLADFANASYALTKANIPQEGRVAIIDPYTALELDKLPNLMNMSNNPTFRGVIETGLNNGQAVIRQIYGFSVVISNYLPTVASETISGTAVTTARACIFMSVADDQVKPFARAWRRVPQATTFDNVQRMREEYRITARWGTGLIRPDGLVVMLAKAPTSGFSV